MIITCKECNSSFNVDDGLIKETGSKVRCSKCENIFVAYPHSLEDKLLLDSDEQLLSSDGSSSLDDLDSTLEGFLNDEESLETPTSQMDADDELGIGLGLDNQFEDEEETPTLAAGLEESEHTSVDVEDRLAKDSVSAEEDMLEVTADRLDLDLNIDDGADFDASEVPMRDNELQDLSDSSNLNDGLLNEVDNDADLEDLDFDLDNERNQETSGEKFGIDGELGLTDIDFGEETKKELETPETEDSEDLSPNLLLNQEINTPEFDGISDANLTVEKTDESDLADLDFEGDDATTAQAPSVEDSEDLDLDLLLNQDSDNQDVEEVQDSGMVAEETDELDLAELDFEGDDATTAQAPSVEDSEDLDLDLLLDQDSDNQDVEEVKDSGMVAEETDELDLADLDFEDDDATTTQAPSVEDSEDLDLDLLLDQDSNNQDVEEIKDSDMVAEETDELDLADLDSEGDDATTVETPSVEDSEDLDLDLLLDQDSDNQDVEEIKDSSMVAEETDELDLADLDFEGDDVTAVEAASGEKSENFDLDFGSEPENIVSDSDTFGDELDLSDLEEIIDSEPDEFAEDSPETLELDLEQKDDQGVLATDTPASVENDDELDFSDLDKMFETSGSQEDSSEGEDSDELELQFDIDEPIPSVVDTPISSDAAEEDDGLLDIEKMLEENEAADDNDLDSKLAMETAIEDATEKEEDLDLDFDLESELQEKEVLFDGSATADDELESNLLSSDDTKIDGDEFEEEEFQGAVTTDEFATDELLETSDTFDETDIHPETENAPSTPAAMMPKSRSKKPVLVALLLLFLTGGILVIPNMLGINIPYVSDIKIPYLSDLDIKIPYLSDKLNPEEKDAVGNLKMIPLAETITARFVNDSQGNQRFVIHGKIKNDYDHPRSFIKVTGKIYQKDGKIAKTETVYCGNMLSDSELTGMKILAVNKRLHNRFGDRKSNLKVKTGKTIPFMIVFEKLPQNLDEYTVEVDGSSI
jgi:pilus assembly protein FimV